MVSSFFWNGDGCPFASTNSKPKGPGNKQAHSLRKLWGSNNQAATLGEGQTTKQAEELESVVVWRKAPGVSASFHGVSAVCTYTVSLHYINMLHSIFNV